MAESKKAETKKTEKRYLNIYEAIPLIMADMSAVSKGKKNQQQGFLYRGIDDLYNELHPILAKYGVFTSPEVLEERTEERKTRNGGSLIYRILKMKYTFYASDGSSFESIVMGEGMDSGDKACNKAMSIAHKYAFFQVFSVATEDLVDPDSETHPESSKKENNNAPTPKNVTEPKANAPTVFAGNKGGSKPADNKGKTETKTASKAKGTGEGNAPSGGGDTTGFPAYAVDDIGSMFQAAVSVVNSAKAFNINPLHIAQIMKPANQLKGSGDVNAMAMFMADLKNYIEETEEVREEKIKNLGVI